MVRLPELLSELLAMLPPWAVPLVLGAIAVVAVPAWLKFVAAKQVRGHLRQAFYAKNAADRQQALDAAFARAGGKPALLVSLADDALKMGLKPAFQRAIAELEAAGGHPDDLRRLRGVQVGDAPKRGGHPIEEVVAIDRMIESGLLVGARARLADARKRFGDDPDLVAAAARIEAAAARIEADATRIEADTAGRDEAPAVRAQREG